ncbi:hypothetical protein M2272_003906 [Mycobacterium frederiksbergense]|uniref:DUF4878 domain-containing protein n=1 Tax=Mycolicibacterium frederiksbergense TaxID=117567 RepID=A0ABT6L2W3_9MYCO|nr:hypothetical protein [Mycolicibacterium frederiksbergense]MDH6197253.1 hypothetical protein [Mycolicibacterium frederiksbergense]
MTYPPSNPPTPPSGPTGPWQQPYPQQGAPQGYPQNPNPEQAYGSGQQPYGAPQQPYGTPYGAPQQPQQPYGTPYGAPQQPQQPYGTPYGAQQPYGAPQQPFGYPDPQPAGGGNGKWLLIAGAVLAVLVLVGGVAIFAFTRDSGSTGGRTSAGSSHSSSNPGESDAEAEVRDFLEEMMANSSTDLSGALPYFCQADQDLFESIGGLDAIDIPHSTETDGSTKITKITVTGNKAVVDISNQGGAGKLYLRKESGSWKICMSDMPGMPAMR